ncbi:hypothetical protein X798_02413, partial [Onchocerca flexuosa]
MLGGIRRTRLVIPNLSEDLSKLERYNYILENHYGHVEAMELAERGAVLSDGEVDTRGGGDKTDVVASRLTCITAGI